MKRLIFSFLLLTVINFSFAQQKDFSYWEKLLRTEKNFQKFIYYSNISKERAENKFYGDDFRLIRNIDKDCFKNKPSLINCLNKAGFKKSKEFADNSFSQQDAMLAFRKANPEFIKLPQQTQQKLLLKYFK